jgi:hypothetical protein
VQLPNFSIRRRNDLYTHCMNTYSRYTLLGKHLIAGFIAIFIINFSFELTGNTLRDSNNICTAISGGESSGSIFLPNKSAIRAAYLYWSGSGAIDNNVTLNGYPVPADATDIKQPVNPNSGLSSRCG